MIDPATAILLSQLSLAIKEYFDTKEGQEAAQQQEQLSKYLYRSLENIKESTAVSETMITDVLRKLEDLECQISSEKPNLKIDILNNFIHGDIREYIASDFPDQVKWIIQNACLEPFSLSAVTGGVLTRFMTYERKYLEEDADYLVSIGFLRESRSVYHITRKGEKYAELGFSYIVNFDYFDTKTGDTVNAKTRSNYLHIAHESIEVFNSNKSPLKQFLPAMIKGPLQDDAYLEIKIGDNDWIKRF